MMSVNNVVQRILSTNLHRQCKIRSLCSSVTISKDSNLTGPDILMSRFKNATSIQGVLDTFSKHKNVMNSKHILQALRTVFLLQRDGRSEVSTNYIINSKQFIQLCGKLRTVAGSIDPFETIEALKFVSYVGVPKDSTIVQVLLQILRHHINDLNLQQIVFTDFLLSQYADVPLAEALKIALPIVFEIQLPIKLDCENIQSLRECLHFASKHRLSDKSIDHIVKQMIKYNGDYNLQIAKSIVWSLADLTPKHCFEHLITKNLDILRTSRDHLSINDLDITLRKLIRAYKKSRYPFYRNKSFCDYVSHNVVNNNNDFCDCIYLMKKMGLLCVTNKSLVDFVSNMIAGKRVDKENDFYYDYVFLKYLSNTDYRPINWNIILEKFKNMEIKNIENVDTFELAVILCYHQIFDENIITQVFNQDLEKIFLKGKINYFLALYHSLLLYKPELLHLLPCNFNPKDYVEDLITPETLPLEGALFSAFGGEKYVKSRIYSKGAIFIDHMILFRKGGYPVATTLKSKFVEDLFVPEDNELVLIMCLQPEAYTEEFYLKKEFAFRLQVLENLGYTVVPVCLENWKSLLDYEKIPYLVQNVKNKLGPDMSVDTYG